MSWVKGIQKFILLLNYLLLIKHNIPNNLVSFRLVLALNGMLYKTAYSLTEPIYISFMVSC
jgi:hypothetical protein